jgi:hypothetical protein
MLHILSLENDSHNHVKIDTYAQIDNPSIGYSKCHIYAHPSDPTTHVKIEQST